MNEVAKKWKKNFSHSPPSLNVSLALVFGFASGETLRQKKKIAFSTADHIDRYQALPVSALTSTNPCRLGSRSPGTRLSLILSNKVCSVKLRT